MTAKNINHNIDNLKQWIADNQDRLIEYAELPTIGHDAVDSASIIENIIAGIESGKLSAIFLRNTEAKDPICPVMEKTMQRKQQGLSCAVFLLSQQTFGNKVNNSNDQCNQKSDRMVNLVINRIRLDEKIKNGSRRT